ncbi:formate dehydrogenase subunit gamma [Sulfurospirillum sp. 1612]|uniref:formate dehydrogenase subunit gamma n=1 Tax=Sulfurospirillum sp. 1612 TaxID=3094835 RepID=UPI002F93DBF1
MKKLILLSLSILGLYARELTGKVPLASKDIAPSQGGDLLVSSQMITNILDYQKFGDLFTYLQAHYFKVIFLGILIGVPLVFLLHYLIIGAKRFIHGGKRIYFFTLFNRIVHWVAAVAFVVLIPTGLMMVFGKYLGGGEPIRIARELHGYFTPVFIISVIPMFISWFKEMLPTFDDVKWLFIVGGYLSKKKIEVPAGKFNAGQKMWFWIATLGGIVMIITGAAMFFQNFDLGIAKSLDMTQIDLLRLSALVHNILGFAVLALFLTHIYMSVFAIKGSLQSMKDGYKEEDEVAHLHSSYYKKLKKEGKI